MTLEEIGCNFGRGLYRSQDRGWIQGWSSSTFLIRQDRPYSDSSRLRKTLAVGWAVRVDDRLTGLYKRL